MPGDTFMIRFAVLGLCLFSVSTGSAQSAKEIATALEDAALNSRMAVDKYDVSLDFSFPINPDSLNWVAARIYRDTDRVRSDFLVRYREDEKFSTLTSDQYWTKNIFRPDQHIFFSFQEFPGSSQRVVEVNTDPDLSSAKHQESLVSLDVRSLGFHPSGFTTNLPIDDVFRSLSRPERTVVDDEVDGVPCKRVSLTLESGVACDFWISPSQGHAILRSRGYFEEYKMQDEINLTVAEWNSSGLWFPISYDYKRSFGGKVTQHERATIKVNSINQEHAPDTFEIKGLDVPVGRSVRMFPTPPGPKRIWDGQTAVLKDSRPPVQETSSRRVFLIINAVVAITLCCFFFGKSRRVRQ